MKGMIKVKKIIMIGEISDINRYRIDDIKRNYFPTFIVEFSTFSSFIKWAESAKKPLIGGNYLAIIREENFYTRMMERVHTISELRSQNDVYDLVYIVKPRETFQEISAKDIEIIILKRTFRDDFSKMIENELNIGDKDYKNEITKTIINRIGYSIADFNVYKQDLLALPILTENTIRKVITEKKLKPIAEILEGLLTRNRAMLKEHYRLCNKYSSIWTMNMYLSILEDILKAKRDLRRNKSLLADIRKDDELRPYIAIIKDVRTVDIFTFRYLIQRNSGIAIEQYYTAESSLQIIDSLNINKLGGLIDVKAN